MAEDHATPNGSPPSSGGFSTTVQRPPSPPPSTSADRIQEDSGARQVRSPKRRLAHPGPRRKYWRVSGARCQLIDGMQKGRMLRIPGFGSQILAGPCIESGSSGHAPHIQFSSLLTQEPHSVTTLFGKEGEPSNSSLTGTVKGASHEAPTSLLQSLFSSQHRVACTSSWLHWSHDQP